MAKFFTLELAIQFYNDSKNIKLPSHLRDQFLRASSSIALNLSEGSAKPTIKDRRRFYYIALGSLNECKTILRLGNCDPKLANAANFLGLCIYRLAEAKF